VIDFRIIDGAAWVTLRRPERANAIDPQLARELLESIRIAEDDPSCHVLVVASSGKHFSAGGDLAGVMAQPDPVEAVRELATIASDVMRRLATSRLAVVSVVQGPVAGAGVALVLASDIVLASDEASFLSAYGAVGLTPDCGVSHLLPRVVGPRRAVEFCILGRRLTADEAADWGIVNEVVPRDRLDDRAAELAVALMSSAVGAIGPAKALLNTDALVGYENAIRLEIDTIAARLASPDAQARIGAFFGKASERT